MSINANYLVSLPPRILRGGSADLETNGMIFVSTDLIPSDKPALTFTDTASVAAVFGASADVTKFAQQYFAGINNQQHIPSALVVGADLTSAKAAWIRSGAVASLAEYQAITAGALTLTINGTEVAATGIDLSACTSLSAVATAVAAEFTGVTGAYNSDLKRFIFKTEATGEDATISYGSGSLADLLGLTESAGAVLSQGIDALTIAANLDAICEVTRNWSQFTTLTEQTDEARVREFAAWTDLDDDYFYLFWTSDERVNDALTVDATIAGKIQDDFNVVLSVFTRSIVTAAAVLAYPASIAWNLPQGMKVLFAKSAANVPADVTSQDVAAVLDANRISYVGEFATRNAQFRFFNKGRLTGDLYGYVDTLIGMIWFRAKIQRCIMDGFAQTNRVPYTQKGYSLIQAWIADAIRAAKNVGVIDEGVTLSESQRAQATQEFGRDIADELYAKGWYLLIADPEAAVRTQRGTPVMSLLYTYGGSVQKVEMPVTAAI